MVTRSYKVYSQRRAFALRVHKMHSTDRNGFIHKIPPPAQDHVFIVLDWQPTFEFQTKVTAQAESEEAVRTRALRMARESGILNPVLEEIPNA